MSAFDIIILEDDAQGSCDAPLIEVILPGPRAYNWEWDTVPVPDEVDIVYSPLFRYRLSPIIFIGGSPVKWAALGIIQNKRDQPGEEDMIPFLDFSNYTLGGNETQGDIDFQYKIS